VKFLDDVAPTLSVTVTVNCVAAVATVGVPVIWPLAALIDNPAGSAGLIANARGAVPPAAVTGVKAVIGAPEFTTLTATACVVVSVAFTVSVNVADAVAPAASVIVTVRIVAPWAKIGVPLTAPVVALNDIPAGSAPPAVMANDSGAEPPVAVTGVNVGMAVPAVPTVAETAWLATSVGFTVSENVLAEFAPASSVTVTVKTVVASVAVGVPLIAPVAGVKLNPAGSVPPVNANEYGVVPPLAVTGVNDAIALPCVPTFVGTA
jgi:hypothetical protein